MFRRPLLGGLNQVWKRIESFSSSGNFWKTTPDECRLELLRFVGLLPLARMDFRQDIDPMVTCSDASTSGGGICRSIGLTSAGDMVAQGQLRGDIPEQPHDFCDL